MEYQRAMTHLRTDALIGLTVAAILLALALSGCMVTIQPDGQGCERGHVYAVASQHEHGSGCNHRRGYNGGLRGVRFANPAYSRDGRRGVAD